METMHSKFVRLQTALLMLALLFTVLVPVPAYAAGEGGVLREQPTLWPSATPTRLTRGSIRRAITTLPQVAYLGRQNGGGRQNHLRR